MNYVLSDYGIEYAHSEDILPVYISLCKHPAWNKQDFNKWKDFDDFYGKEEMKNFLFLETKHDIRFVADRDFYVQSVFIYTNIDYLLYSEFGPWALTKGCSVNLTITFNNIFSKKDYKSDCLTMI